MTVLGLAFVLVLADARASPNASKNHDSSDCASADSGHSS